MLNQERSGYNLSCLAVLRDAIISKCCATIFPSPTGFICSKTTLEEKKMINMTYAITPSVQCNNGRGLPSLDGELERVFLHTSHRQRGWCLVARSSAWNWGGRSARYSAWCSTAIMSHVSLHKMASRKGSAKTELSGKNSGCDDTGKLSSIVARGCGMWASHS